LALLHSADDATRDKIKANRTVYPKGYVEMLERQQTQLVAGLQVLYRKLTNNEHWEGEKLPEYDDQPRTQDILAALGLVQPLKNTDSHMEEFQDILPSTGGDDIDGDVASRFSNAANRQQTRDPPNPVQTDLLAPSFEAEPAETIGSRRYDWNQEEEAKFLKSLEATLSTTVPSSPDISSQNRIPTNLENPLVYRPERMLGDDTRGLGSSATPPTLPTQSFEFNVDPTALPTKGTYSRRGRTM
jgi:hypothetical protein